MIFIHNIGPLFVSHKYISVCTPKVYINTISFTLLYIW